jgi:sec-independent protein translocase protein TatA
MAQLAAIFGLGPTELFIIVFVIILLFGPKRLPELGRGIGKTIRELRKAQEGKDEEEEEEEKKEKKED